MLERWELNRALKAILEIKKLAIKERINHNKEVKINFENLSTPVIQKNLSSQGH